ncbi:MAG: hypothetical protein Nk1A_7290 [Endomicrobiia bacterium]|nr:MAG: hypothetical protein Nk1A_7290 [Endomicrobiia bacterium]
MKINKRILMLVVCLFAFCLCSCVHMVGRRSRPIVKLGVSHTDGSDKTGKKFKDQTKTTVYSEVQFQV